MKYYSQKSQNYKTKKDYEDLQEKIHSYLYRLMNEDRNPKAENHDTFH